MSADGLDGSIRPSPPRGRLGYFAPWPLVGVALILAVLVVLTPALIANGHQPPPGVLTQAELVVDKISGSSELNFYIWALGETIRYDVIRVGLANDFNWTGTSSINWSQLSWAEWDNGSDLLSVSFSSTANPLALNISVHYVSPSGSTWYAAMIAFYVSPSSPSSGENLYSTSATPGVALASPIPVSNSTLPVAILLANVGPGGPP